MDPEDFDAQGIEAYHLDSQGLMDQPEQIREALHLVLVLFYDVLHGDVTPGLRVIDTYTPNTQMLLDLTIRKLHDMVCEEPEKPSEEKHIPLPDSIEQFLKDVTERPQD